ncbi:hypothetical protein [Pectobacterium brasiliense]|uniref:hypothetical protein n=1 Tax=Pectobacterium brasiliense TaxID=180957 RepID=UPI001968E1DC|nr:hypothetical protein [Pectobacterium brasiliense]MBN3262950.1 hypothetical protein [Pectobacterium brasiliense]
MKDLNSAIKFVILGVLVKTISDLLDYSIPLTQNLIKGVAYIMWAAAIYFMVKVSLNAYRKRNVDERGSDEIN